MGTYNYLFIESTALVIYDLWKNRLVIENRKKNPKNKQNETKTKAVMSSKERDVAPW